MTARSSLSGITAQLGGLLAWWRDELAGMLPARLRRRGGPRVVLDLRGTAEGGTPVVARRALRGGGAGGWAALGPLGGGRRAARALAAEARPVLAVPAGWVLRRVLRLPEAAEPRLGAVLAYEIEQHVPFAAGEVLWDVRVARRLPEQQRIEVEVAILPRHLVAPAATALREAGVAGPLLARPEPLEAWPSLPLDPLSPPGRRWRPWLEAGLAGAAALLLLQLGLGDLGRGEAAAVALEARAAAARAAAAEVQALEGEAAALRARLALAAELRGGRPASGAVLEEVARRLPDEVWLTEWRLQGDQLTLAGFATRSDGLLGLLDASPSFAEVRFAAPLTRDRRDTADRFQVALRVLPPGAPKPAPSGPTATGAPPAAGGPLRTAAGQAAAVAVATGGTSR